MTSNSVPQFFSGSFFTGGFLDNNEKYEVLRNLEHVNHFSFISEYGASFLLKPACKSDTVHCSRLFGGVSHQTMVFASFPKDAAELVLFGNARDVVRSYYVNDASLDYHQFLKLYVGATLGFGANREHCFALAPFVSIHKPPVEFDMEYAKITTSADTSMISMKIRGDLNFGLPLESFTQSIGGGIDIRYINSGLMKSHIIAFSAENLGVFQYQANSYSLNHDSAFIYTGIFLTDFNNIDSTLASFSDSIISISGLKHDTISKAVMLPLRLRVEIINAETERYGISGSITSYPFNQWRPVFECVPTFRFGKYMKTGIPVFLGEASGYGAGIYLEYLSKSMFFSLIGKSNFKIKSGYVQNGMAIFVRVAFRL